MCALHHNNTHSVTLEIDVQSLAGLPLFSPKIVSMTISTIVVSLTLDDLIHVIAQDGEMSSLQR